MFFVQMHNIRAGGRGRLFFPVVSAKTQKLLPSNWTCSNKRQGRGLFDFQSIKTRSLVLRACSSSLPHNTTSCKSKLSHQQKEPKIVQLCMLLLVQLKNRPTKSSFEKLQPDFPVKTWMSVHSILEPKCWAVPFFIHTGVWVTNFL